MFFRDAILEALKAKQFKGKDAYIGQAGNDYCCLRIPRDEYEPIVGVVLAARQKYHLAINVHDAIANNWEVLSEDPTKGWKKLND